MYTDILILSRLAHGPAHGYEIKKGVERVVGPKSMNNNVLYPALRRFEADGVIERVSQESQSGRPPRTVFRLTDTGVDLLQALLRDTDPDILADHAEFQVRLSFFDQLAPDERLAILAARRGCISGQIKLQEGLRADAVAEHPWGAKVIDFNLSRMREEIDWLDELAMQAAPGAATTPGSATTPRAVAAPGSARR